MSVHQICDMDRLKKWWVLSGAEGVGPVKLKDWIESVGSLEDAWDQAKRRDSSFSSKERQRLDSLALTLSEEGFWAISWEDQAYPRSWRELRDAPVVVFGSGNQRAMNDRPFAAVVGTRDCSQRAAELGFEVGCFLAVQDWGVVSGLARGVDAMAHRGACYAEGLTVACLGSPLRPIYPREHRELAGEIVRCGGALISEHAHEAEVHRWHFAARNRRIVAMAEALVMIQSPARGGALISAQLALDSGVDCWVYRPDDRTETGKRWAGNRTILDEFPDMGWSSMEELFARLGQTLRAATPNQLEQGLPADLLPIWRWIVQKGGAQISDIAHGCKMEPEAIGRKLFIMELKGLVQRIPGGWYVPQGLG